jgi:hypothetical protein
MVDDLPRPDAVGRKLRRRVRRTAQRNEERDVRDGVMPHVLQKTPHVSDLHSIGKWRLLYA